MTYPKDDTNALLHMFQQRLCHRIHYPSSPSLRGLRCIDDVRIYHVLAIVTCKQNASQLTCRAKADQDISQNIPSGQKQPLPRYLLVDYLAIALASRTRNSRQE